MRKFSLLVFFIIILIGCRDEFTKYPDWNCGDNDDGVDFDNVFVNNRERQKITISTECNDLITRELKIEDIYIKDDNEDNYSLDTSRLDDEIGNCEETSFYIYFQPKSAGLKKSYLIIKTNSKDKKIRIKGVGIE